MDNIFKRLSTYIHNRLEFMGLVIEEWDIPGHHEFWSNEAVIIIEKRYNRVSINYIYDNEDDDNDDHYYNDGFTSNNINELYRYIDFIFNDLTLHHPDLDSKPGIKF